MFSEILKDLRTECNMSQSELAKKLDISPSTVGMYEQGRRYPDFDTLIKIANHFNVSLDFLLGRSENRNDNKESEYKVYPKEVIDLYEEINELAPEKKEIILKIIKDL